MELIVNQPLTALLEGCRQGNAASYRDLYNRYAKAMYNTCLRIVNNSADAEDILQEAFTAAFKSLDKFECEAAFGSWLKRIVVNKAINKIKRERFHWLELDVRSATQIQEDEGVDEAGFAYQVEEVKRALQALPDGYRTILSLYLLEDYKHHEIASMLNLSASTVRTQYIRGRNKLLQLIKDNQ